MRDIPGLPPDEQDAVRNDWNNVQDRLNELPPDEPAVEEPVVEEPAEEEPAEEEPERERREVEPPDVGTDEAEHFQEEGSPTGHGRGHFE